MMAAGGSTEPFTFLYIPIDPEAFYLVVGKPVVQQWPSELSR